MIGRGGGHRFRRAAALALAALTALVALVGTAGARPVAAQQAETGALLLIMDASGSMNATDDTGTPLIAGAKAALTRSSTSCRTASRWACGSTATARPTPTRSPAARTPS